MTTSTTISPTAMAEAREEREEKEGPIARAIERRTAKMPSDGFLWAAGVAIAGSAALQLLAEIGGFRATKWFGRKGMFAFGARPRHLSLFVGEWAPTLLLLGLYKKLAKAAGAARYEQAGRTAE
jgi:hypothetical protein